MFPSDSTQHPAPSTGEQRVYVATTDQVWQLYELFPESMRVAVMLGAFVGLRLSEACGLRVEDIDSGPAAEDEDLEDTGSRPRLADHRVLGPDQRPWSA
jgi:integrase